MSSCRRTWEVEAAHDGRLTGSDRESLARHLASCATCSAEAQKLEQLQRELRALPLPQTDELKIRRQRHELVARAFAERAVPSRSRRNAFLALAAGAALAFGVFALTRGPAGTDSAARVTVAASVGAHYARSQRAGRELVDLRRGTLTFRVRVGTQRRVLIVRTPDGHIEDLGTVFSVTVDGDRTRMIQVAEGRVVARLRGRPARWIDAGETYRPYEKQIEAPHEVQVRGAALPVSAPAGSRSAPGASAVPAGAERPSTALRTAESVDAVAKAAKQRLHASHPTPHVSTPAGGHGAAQHFAQALARVEVGDDVGAAAELERFLRQYPDAPYREDAAFLRVALLRRLGDMAKAREAAAFYLARHPRGFRAPELRKLLDEKAKAP